MSCLAPRGPSPVAPNSSTFSGENAGTLIYRCPVNVDWARTLVIYGVLVLVVPAIVVGYRRLRR